MPRISAFYGIVIWMYHDEVHHGGRPHFHASYGGDEATIDIESLATLAGGATATWAATRGRVGEDTPG
jgi:hypothetical protein